MTQYLRRVTGGPNGDDSSRSSLSEDDDYGESLEVLFTQHYQSLTQEDADDAEDDDTHESTDDVEGDDLDLKPAAKQDFQRDENIDEFADDELDAELGELDVDAAIADAEEKSRSPTWKQPACNMVEDQAKDSKLLRSKKRRHTLFETAATCENARRNKRKRKSTGSSTTSIQKNTLTQHFSPVKKQKQSFTTPSEPAASKRVNGMVEIRIPGKPGLTSFKPGDVWLPRGEKYSQSRLDFIAFTLGEIGIENQVYVAEIAAAWMKLEKAFLGPEEADYVKQECAGSDWVLVRKHELLPQDGKIKLNDLSERLLHNLPNMANTLCCEMDSKTDHAFYYECKVPAQIPNQNDKPSAIDFFAGGGGMSIELERAGIDVKYKVEMNKTACDRLNMNFPDSHVFCEDIAKFTNSCQTQRVSVYPKRGENDYIHGSPPCQGLSAVNTGGGANDHQNNQCTIEFFESIKCLQPSFVSMENVPGLTQDKNIKYLLRIVAGLLSESYQVRTSKVNSSNYGDPQSQLRIIVLASKKGYALPKLAPTHGQGLPNRSHSRRCSSWSRSSRSSIGGACGIARWRLRQRPL